MTRRRALFFGWVLAWIVALGLAMPMVGEASSRSKGGSTRSGQRNTVHVKGYTKKDGTKVAAHERKARAPGSTRTRATPTVRTAPSNLPARDAKGRFVRSESAKHTFEVQTGFPHGRPGYVVDHVRPLACGGADVPSNMQWQTIAEGKAKDKIERAGCR